MARNNQDSEDKDSKERYQAILALKDKCLRLKEECLQLRLENAQLKEENSRLRVEISGLEEENSRLKHRTAEKDEPPEKATNKSTVDLQEVKDTVDGMVKLVTRLVAEMTPESSSNISSKALEESEPRTRGGQIKGKGHATYGGQEFQNWWTAITSSMDLYSFRNDQDKIDWVSAYLPDKVLEWHNARKQRLASLLLRDTWESYKKAIQEQFGNSARLRIESSRFSTF
ncbi:hypothetical protein VTH82DRAFT_6272 [Thermothelomyces myriococcoides]